MRPSVNWKVQGEKLLFPTFGLLKLSPSSEEVLFLFSHPLFLPLHILLTDWVLLLPHLQSLLGRLPNEPPRNLPAVVSIIKNSPAFPFTFFDGGVFWFDNASISETDTCKVTTAHSRYNAPGLNTSSGIAWGACVSCTGPLNGAWRRGACNTDCIAISGDLKKNQRMGCRMTYTGAILKSVECIVQSVLKREMVSTLLMPGYTLTVMMFGFCTLVLTRGTEDEPLTALRL